MSDLTLRSATTQDIPAIAAIYEHAVLHGTATFEIEPPGATEMTRRLQALQTGGFPYLVATLGEQVTGYAYAGPHRARPAYRWCVEDSIYVAPTAHRRGVGRLLLTELIVETEKRGFRQMVAVIGDSANQSSVALHGALDFTMVGTLANVGFKHGRWLDTVLMQRALGAGAAAKP